MKTIEDMIKMPLNSEQSLNGEKGVWVRRVPGGWIYEIHHEDTFQTAFVPFPEE